MLSWKMKIEVFAFPAAWQLRYEHITWSPSVPFSLPEVSTQQLEKQSPRNGRTVSWRHSCGSRETQGPGMIARASNSMLRGVNFTLQGLGAMEGSIWGAICSDLRCRKMSLAAAWRTDWIQEVWRQTSAGKPAPQFRIFPSKTLGANTATLVFYDATRNSLLPFFLSDRFVHTFISMWNKP